MTMVEDPGRILAKGMTELSIKERESVFYDLHGVAEEINEEPEFIAKRLAELDVAIANTPNREAYEKANRIDPLYVHSLEFRLMFLRSERFDAKQTASRLIRHFETKLDLFGPECLAREIRYEDLHEGAVKCLEAGYLQLLPLRDRTGRAIISCMPTLRCGSPEDNVRANWYVMMNALRDEGTQRKGVVGILLFNGKVPAPDDQQHLRKLVLLVTSVPMFLPGGHICTDNSMFLPLTTAFLSYMDRLMKTRHKIHIGSNLECIYELMTFGIPTEVLPFNASGETRLEDHHKWIVRQRILEGGSDDTKRITIPGPFDVLLGREKISQEHVGNVRYHFVIDTHIDHFESSSVREKTAVTREMVQLIKASGGRFLKLDNTGWAEVSDEDARKKVASAFRSKRKSGKGPVYVQNPIIKSTPRPLGSPTPPSDPSDEETTTSIGSKRSR